MNYTTLGGDEVRALGLSWCILKPVRTKDIDRSAWGTLVVNTGVY
jgi:hypothetical protein